MSRYVRAIISGLERAHSHEVLVHGERRVTGGELLEAVYRRARALQDRGLARGQGMACLVGMSVEAIVTQLACYLLGRGP